MSDLYLNPGESLILTTNSVSVNFIPFDLMLTNLRLILFDSVHERFRPQIIPLGDIFSVSGGSVSTGEPIIRITITDHEGDGSQIPIDFIFSQLGNQKRKSERDAWLMTLMEKLVDVRQEKVLSGIEPSGRDEEEKTPVQRWIAPEILHPVPLVTGPDLPTADTGAVPETAGSPVDTGDIGNEIGDHGKSAAEVGGLVVPPREAPEPGSPEPLEEILPETIETEEPGLLNEEIPIGPVRKTGPVDLPASPADLAQVTSKKFVQPLCTPSDSEEEPGSPGTGSSPAEMPGETPDTVPEEAASSGPLPSEEIVQDESFPSPGIEPADVPADSPGVVTAGDSSFDEETLPEPAPERDLTPPVVNWPVIREEPVSLPHNEAGETGKSPGDLSSRETLGNPPLTGQAVSRNQQTPAGRAVPHYSRPVIEPENTPGQDQETGSSVRESASPTPGMNTGARESRVPPSLSGKPEEPAVSPSGMAPRRHTLMIATAVGLCIILVIVALGFISLQNPHDTANTQVPLVTPNVTIHETPAVNPVTIPNVGVWIHVIYPGNFYGKMGNPAELSEIGGTGDKFYFIRNSGNLLQADIQKQDYSGDTLTVEVFNNGTKVFNSSVRSPMGTIHFFIDPMTGKSPVSQS